MGLKSFQNLTSDFPASWLDDNFTYLEDLINNFSVPAAADTSVTFTDITTNNATVNTHGFLAKLNGLGNEAMLGTGVWGILPKLVKAVTISATGSIAFTGVGFKPSAAIFLSIGNKGWSIGLDDGTHHMCMTISAPGVSPWAQINDSTACSINAIGAQTITGYVTSWDDDGFTITSAGFIAVSADVYCLLMA